MCRTVLYQKSREDDGAVDDQEDEDVEDMEYSEDSESESEDEDEPNEGAESPDEYGLAFSGVCPGPSPHWSDNPTYLETIKDRSTAQTFITRLWGELWELGGRSGAICDGDIERAIHLALRGVENHPVLWHRQYSSVMGVARNMLRKQYRIEPLSDLGNGELGTWVHEMGETVRWRPSG